MKYRVGAASDPGKRRTRNEDSIFAMCSLGDSRTLPYGLFVVADGTGAYANGQDASCGAIQAIIDVILPAMVRSTIHQPAACTTLLTTAIQAAKMAVIQQNIDLHSVEGTDEDVGVIATITTVMLCGSTAYIAHVGDCRAYLYRASEGLKKITTDHLLVARLNEAGILKPDDLYTHWARYALERCLGTDPSVEGDLFTVQVYPGDTLLLCSVGLWRMVRDPEIEEVLARSFPDSSRTTEALIQAALDGGGKDNTSVIVVSLEKKGEQAHVPGMQLFVKPDCIRIPQVMS